MYGIILTAGRMKSRILKVMIQRIMQNPITIRIPRKRNSNDLTYSINKNQTK